MNQTLGMSYVGAFSEKPTEEFLLRIEETIWGNNFVYTTLVTRSD
jgi:hypothetical protein